MDKLQRARKTIGEVDAEIAKLFCKRMEAAALVAEYKKERGLPVPDQSREDALIAQNSALVEDPVFREYYVNFLRYTMKLSRDYQQRLISGMRVAYGGVPGAFASEAAELLYPDGEYISCADFIAAYRASKTVMRARLVRSWIWCFPALCISTARWILPWSRICLCCPAPSLRTCVR